MKFAKIFFLFFFIIILTSLSTSWFFESEETESTFGLGNLSIKIQPVRRTDMGGSGFTDPLS